MLARMRAWRAEARLRKRGLLAPGRLDPVRLKYAEEVQEHARNEHRQVPRDGKDQPGQADPSSAFIDLSRAGDEEAEDGCCRVARPELRSRGCFHGTPSYFGVQVPYILEGVYHPSARDAREFGFSA